MSLAALLSFTFSTIVLAIAPGPDNIFVLTQSAMHGYKKGLAVVIGLAIGICIQSLCMVAGVTTLFITMPALITVLKAIGALYLSYLCYKATQGFIALYKAKDHTANETSDLAPAQQNDSDDTSYVEKSDDDKVQRADCDDLSSGAVYEGGSAVIESKDHDNEYAANNHALDGKAQGSDELVSDNRVLNYKMIRRGVIMNCTNPKVQLFFLSFFPQFLPKNLTQNEVMFYMSIMGLIMAIVTLVVFGAIAIFAGKLAAQFKTRRFNLILNGSAALIFAALAIFTLGSELI